MASLKDMKKNHLENTKEYKERETWIEELCNEYAANNMQKLKMFISKKISAFGISTDDQRYLDFLSMANWQLYMLLRSFDPDKNDSVHGYVEAKIVYKMNTALRDVSTQKLVNYARDEKGNIKEDKDGYRTIITNVSLEYKNEDGYSVSDICKSKFDIHKAVFGEDYSDEYYKYMAQLGKKERRVAKKIEEGYTHSEIAELLHMTSREVEDCIKEMKETKNISIFYRRYKHLCMD